MLFQKNLNPSHFKATIVVLSVIAGLFTSNTGFSGTNEDLEFVKNELNELYTQVRNQKLLVDRFPLKVETEQKNREELKTSFDNRLKALEARFQGEVVNKTLDLSKQVEEQKDRLNELIQRKVSKRDHESFEQKVESLDSKMKKFVRNQIRNQVREASWNEGFIGEIRYSILDELQFQRLYGTNWVLMAGQSIEESELARLSGMTHVPDPRGLYLRVNNSGRKDEKGNPDGDLKVGTLQNDEFNSHTHGVNDNGHTHPQNVAANFQHGGTGTMTDWNGQNGYGALAYYQGISTNSSTTGISLQHRRQGNSPAVDDRKRLH